MVPLYARAAVHRPPALRFHTTEPRQKVFLCRFFLNVSRIHCLAIPDAFLFFWLLVKVIFYTVLGYIKYEFITERLKFCV